ncbi:MAG: ArsA family ATPase [Sandaracinaceae bacterium]
MKDLLDHDFLFVVGKGGVGKTTVSAALALAARRRGKRVLVAMCNSKERLSQLLGTDPIGPKNQTLEAGFDAVNMEPEVAMEEYGLMILKVRALYEAIFENKFVAAVLRGTPGIEAWSMLGKAYYHVDETRDDGSPRYDLVILDAPATGHALDMFRVPDVILNVAPPGLLRREAEKALALFRDRERTAGVLVTLPEDMPTNETLELHQALTQELRFPVSRLVVNQTLRQLFEGDERTAALELLDRLDNGSPLRGLARAGRQRAVREQIQRDSLDRLREALGDLPRTLLPLIHVPDFERSAVESLAAVF